MFEEIYQDTEKKMLKIIISLKSEFIKIRTGRVNIKLFESIFVECYGKSTKLNNLASIIILNNNSIKINPWDKSNISHIEKSIISANLGITPSIINNSIKINFPAMNEERRKELIKYVKKISENNKIIIRNIRRDKNQILKNLLKNKDISKDQEKIAQDKIQKITNRFILEVDTCLKEKEIELMKI